MMSVTSSGSSSSGGGWRGSTDASAASSKQTSRIVLTVFGIVLLGILGFLLWLWFFRPITYVADLPITGYHELTVPPIPFAKEDTRQLEEMSLVKPVVVWTDDTRRSLNRLDVDLKDELPCRPKDTLIFHLAAHGVSDGGKAYLLGSDFTMDQTERCELSRLLDALRDCPAKLKLLVLDSGPIASDPRLGMAVNEFPRLLEELLVEGEKDSNLWVLASHRPMQVSHASFAARRSIFGYYVTEGLLGAADEEADNPNGRVDLTELYQFVSEGVDNWVYHEIGTRGAQTPWLLKDGEGEVQRPDEQLAELVHVSRKRQKDGADAPADKKADSAKKKSDAKKAPKGSAGQPNYGVIRKAWQLLDAARRSVQDRGSRRTSESWYPVDYAPQDWRRLQDLLLSYEVRYRSGEAFNKDDYLNKLEAFASKSVLSGFSGPKSDRDVGFVSTGLSEEQAGKVRRILQVKHDLLDRAPYYVRWHARVWQASGVRPSAVRSSGVRRADVFSSIMDLLTELAVLVDKLEAVQRRDPAAGSPADVSRILNDLVEQADKVEQLDSELHRTLVDKAIQLAENPETPGNACLIESLLSVPLLPVEQRMALLKALGQPGQTPPKKSRVNVGLGELKEEAAEFAHGQWVLLHIQAQLERQLLLLADRTAKIAVPNRAVAKKTRSQEYARFGMALGRSYQGRIRALTSGDGPVTPAVQRLIRLVDGRDVKEGGESSSHSNLVTCPLRVAPAESPPPRLLEPGKPDRVELVAYRIGETADVLMARIDPVRFRLRPFPNRPTGFRFELKNLFDEDKELKIQLFRMQRPGPGEPLTRELLLQKLREAPADLAAVTAPAEMGLPCNADPKPIRFAPLAPPPKPDTETEETPEEETKPQEGLAIWACVIGEKVDGTWIEHKWVEWIEFKPLAPDEYLDIDKTDLHYDALHGRLTINVKPRTTTVNFPPLGKDPIEVVWDIADEPDLRRVQAQTSIVDTDADVRPLSADLAAKDDEELEIRLDVDGYPRAFVFGMERKANGRKWSERNRARIRITAPQRDPVKTYLVPLKEQIGVEFQVDAPSNAFVEPGDVVLLQMIEEKTGRAQRSEKIARFFADRQVRVSLKEVQVPDGVVKVLAEVSDFKIETGNFDFGDMKVRIQAELQLVEVGPVARKDDLKDSVRIVLDANPPEVRVRLLSRTVPQGASVEAVVEVTDVSGVKRIEVGFDEDQSGALEDAEMQPQMLESDANGRFHVSVVPPERQPPVAPGKSATYRFLLRAVDEVDLPSKWHPEDIIVSPELREEQPRETGTIRSKVSSSTGAAHADVDLTLKSTDPAKPLERVGKTDRNGEFTFADVPFGSYVLVSEKRIKRRDAWKKAAVTVDEKTEPVMVEIILTMFDTEEKKKDE